MERNRESGLSAVRAPGVRDRTSPFSRPGDRAVRIARNEPRDGYGLAARTASGPGRVRRVRKQIQSSAPVFGERGETRTPVLGVRLPFRSAPSGHPLADRSESAGWAGSAREMCSYLPHSGTHTPRLHVDRGGARISGRRAWPGDSRCRVRAGVQSTSVGTRCPASRSTGHRRATHHGGRHRGRAPADQ